MVRMAENFFALSPLLSLPLLTMLLFGAVFIAVSIHTLRAPKAHIAELSKLPLEEADDE